MIPEDQINDEAKSRINTDRYRNNNIVCKKHFLVKLLKIMLITIKASYSLNKFLDFEKLAKPKEIE